FKNTRSSSNACATGKKSPSHSTHTYCTPLSFSFSALPDVVQVESFAHIVTLCQIGASYRARCWVVALIRRENKQAEEWSISHPRPLLSPLVGLNLISSR